MCSFFTEPFNICCIITVHFPVEKTVTILLLTPKAYAKLLLQSKHCTWEGKSHLIGGFGYETSLRSSVPVTGGLDFKLQLRMYRMENNEIINEVCQLIQELTRKPLIMLTLFWHISISLCKIVFIILQLAACIDSFPPSQLYATKLCISSCGRFLAHN